MPAPIPLPRLLACAGMAAGAMGLAGCASETVLTPSSLPASGSPTYASGTPEVPWQDMVEVADSMASNILALSPVADAKATPRIVINPVTNDSGVAIDRDAFLVRIRILLNQRSKNKVRFLSQSMMATLEREARPGFRGTDYVLDGRFDRIADKGGSVLTRFQLTDARTNTVVWRASYTVGADDLAALAPLSS